MDVDHRPHGGRHDYDFDFSLLEVRGKHTPEDGAPVHCIVNGSLPKNPFKGAHLQALIWCIQRGKKEKEEAVKSQISENDSHILSSSHLYQSNS